MRHRLCHRCVMVTDVVTVSCLSPSETPPQAPWPGPVPPCPPFSPLFPLQAATLQAPRPVQRLCRVRGGGIDRQPQQPQRRRRGRARGARGARVPRSEAETRGFGESEVAKSVWQSLFLQEMSCFLSTGARKTCGSCLIFYVP